MKDILLGKRTLILSFSLIVLALILSLVLGETALVGIGIVIGALGGALGILKGSNALEGKLSNGG